MNSHRSNRQVQLHVAIQTDDADRAAVGAADLRLEFADDLHGPDLGGAGDRSARKGGPQQVDGVRAFAQASDNGGGSMEDGRTGFNLSVVGNANCAVFADTAQIVAFEVDDHVEFGAILLAAPECGAGGPVRAELAGARPGSLDGSGDDVAAAKAEKQFGRRRQDGPRLRLRRAGEREKGRIGRGVRLAEPLVEIDGAAREGRAELMGEIDLEDVARPDVIERPLDAVQVVAARHVPDACVRPGGPQRGSTGRWRERSHEPFECVEAFGCRRPLPACQCRGQIDGRSHPLVGRCVVDQQGVEEPPAGHRDRRHAAVETGRRLDEPARFIAEVPDPAARPRAASRPAGRLPRSHLASQAVEWIAGRRGEHAYGLEAIDGIAAGGGVRGDGLQHGAVRIIGNGPAQGAAIRRRRDRPQMARHRLAGASRGHEGRVYRRGRRLSQDLGGPAGC